MISLTGNLQSYREQCSPHIVFHDGGPHHIETRSFILLCKSMDWFLYDKGLRQERVNNIQWFLVDLSWSLKI